MFSPPICYFEEKRCENAEKYDMDQQTAEHPLADRNTKRSRLWEGNETTLLYINDPPPLLAQKCQQVWLQCPLEINGVHK